jgi:hypothetical protein
LRRPLRGTGATHTSTPGRRRTRSRVWYVRPPAGSSNSSSSERSSPPSCASACPTNSWACSSLAPRCRSSLRTRLLAIRTNSASVAARDNRVAGDTAGADVPHTLGLQRGGAAQHQGAGTHPPAPPTDIGNGARGEARGQGAEAEPGAGAAMGGRVRRCPVCGNSLEGRRPNVRYCRPGCRQEAYRIAN